MSEKLLTPVVYTMGKVASSSVSKGILQAGLACHDIHSLAPDYLRKTAAQWLGRGEYPPPHICVSMAHRDRLLIKQKKCLYISLVRDPIARNLSGFFQNLHLQPAPVRDENDPQALFDAFMGLYPHRVPVTWFNREFEGQLGIDVYARGFNHDKKFSYLKGKNVVVFRVDCPDAVKSKTLSRILGRKIEVVRQNDATNKGYADLYSEMKTKAHFTEEFVAGIYDSKFVRHFWTVAERAALMEKWTVVG